MTICIILVAPSIYSPRTPFSRITAQTVITSNSWLSSWGIRRAMRVSERNEYNLCLLTTFLVCRHSTHWFCNCSLSWSLPGFGDVFATCAHLGSGERDGKTELVLRIMKQDFVEIDTSVQWTWSSCWHGNPYVEKRTLLADDFCSTQC